MRELLRDKVYDEMGWLEQASNMWINEFVDALRDAPQQITVSSAALSKYIDATSINMGFLIRYSMPKNVLQLIADASLEILAVYHASMSPDFAYDFIKREIISGTFTFEKRVPEITDAAIKELISHTIGQRVHLYTLTDDEYPRAREVLQLFQINHDKTSKRRIISDISRVFNTNIKEGKWRLQSCGLARKIAHWIYDYVKYGNLTSLANLTKFKLRTYDGVPIYSISEEV